jgi:hypothetical protein
MIKNLILIFFLLAGSSVYAQFNVTILWQPIKPGNGGDTIYYDPERKLTWSDFRGKPVAASPAAAITESGFGYTMSMQSRNKRTTVVITVFCYFNKQHSWVKKDMDTDYALLHEQHHYDITYINACLFVKKLSEADINLRNYDSIVEKIHDESFEALDKMQNDYDGQTANGRIPRIQIAWNKKIDQQLAALTIN